MSRHRHIRQYKYSDDYGDIDDDQHYGQSVEDENYSPAEASFIYDRSKNRVNISSFLDKPQKNSQEMHDEVEPQVINVKELQEKSTTNSPQITVTVAKSSKVSVVEGFVVSKNEAKISESTQSTLKNKCTVKMAQDNLLASASSSRSNSPGTSRPSKSSCSSTPGRNSLNINDQFSDDMKISSSKNKVASKAKTIPAESILDNGKERLNMIVIGHVDAGKSTLMGHALFKLGCVSHKVMQKYEHESKKVGKESFVFAWVLDEGEEERGRGVTIDIGKSKFETDTKSIVLLDAPGHKDFIPNMITGATQADVALLVIDATPGEFETGFEHGGQTKEHTLLVRSLGVNQLVVVINKMDNASWSEDRFNDIQNKLRVFLKQAGFKEDDVYYVPCSGLTGANLTEKTSDPAASWYSGKTLMQVIDLFKAPPRPLNKPFRLSVSDVCRGVGSAPYITGRIETGFINVGTKVLVQPIGAIIVIKGLSVEDNSEQTAYAGSFVNIVIGNSDLESVSVGNVICDVDYPISTSSKFEARIVVFNIVLPITLGYMFVLHMLSFSDSVKISRLIAEVHRVTGEVIKKKPRCLMKNTAAIVTIETSKPICIELYKDIKELGRFMLRDAGVTVAAGLVTKIY